MRRIIDKILRKEEDTKLCPSCGKANSLQNIECRKCGYEFSVERNTPEDGL